MPSTAMTIAKASSTVTSPKIWSTVWVRPAITAEAEVGRIYRGTVRKIVDFGAFVEIFPGTDGLVHISQLADERVRKVSDVLKEGDVIDVKVLEVDRSGKIRLSRKDALKAGGSQEAQH